MSIQIARDPARKFHLLRDGLYLCACRDHTEARAKAKAKSKAWGVDVAPDLVELGDYLPPVWVEVREQADRLVAAINAPAPLPPVPETISALVVELEAGTFDGHLEELLALELEGKNRKGALAAIRGRMLPPAV